ncbi:MAG: bacillithiol biosynthesis cysteine-adding enzyme BshC [Mycobacterium sp.]
MPFRQIPHSSRLFLDYLSGAPSVRDYYPRTPNFADWLTDEAAKVQYDAQRRVTVAGILERENRAWGSSAKTLANLDRFRRGALTVVTGQQVGLFGGPLFSIFKALTAVKLAEQATAAGVDCVPVFWLATEDHDLAEINHVSLLSEKGSLETIAAESRGVPDAPVGTVRLSSEIETVIERVASLLGESDVTTWLRESYRPDETFGGGFARLFARLFADWGVILLDPANPELHRLAAPLFHAAIENASALDEALLARGKALEAAGYHQQVKVTAASTLLFEVKNGARTAVRRKANGAADSEFLSGHETLTQRQLLERIAASPQNFNPNVLLRPIIQDYLLPTLAYTGGAAEIAYFAQAAVVYEKLLGRVTPALPRFSATLLEPKAERILGRYHLQLPDLFHGPENLREKIAARSLPSDLQTRFSEAYATVEKSMSALRDSIGSLDPTLVRAADRARMRMWHQVNRVHRQAGRSELLRNEVIDRHAKFLDHALFPHKALQEREIAGVYFIARYGTSLLEKLYSTIRTDCHDHQVISIQ